MWIFTTCGFFSITQSPVEPGMMQMRARLKSDLETLCQAHGLGARIVETPHADYRWRIVLAPEQLRAVMRGLLACIDYTNFKGAVHDTPGQESKGGPYMRVWAAMKDVQDRDSAASDTGLFRADAFMPQDEPHEPVPDWLLMPGEGEIEAAAAVDPLDNPKAQKPRKKSKARKALDAATGRAAK